MTVADIKYGLSGGSLVIILSYFANLLASARRVFWFDWHGHCFA